MRIWAIPNFGLSLSLKCVVSALSLLLLLVAVAFFTLLERKVLAYIILRRGPNKPSVSGLFVPFADALKLLTKPFIRCSSSSHVLTKFACYLLFVIPSILWCSAGGTSFSWDWSHSLLVILVWLSLSVFALLAAGWGSNSKYSTLAGTRCIAQSISYEVCLTLLFLCFSLFATFNLFPTLSVSLSLIASHLWLCLFVVSLAETNRSPFDFAEGESELVSGYNVEYSGPGFVILFLSEYLSILWMSFLLSVLFVSTTTLIFLPLTVFISFAFIWVRGTLPRYRYDQLIGLAWKSILPLTLSSFVVCLIL